MKLADSFTPAQIYRIQAAVEVNRIVVRTPAQLREIAREPDARD